MPSTVSRAAVCLLAAMIGAVAAVDTARADELSERTVSIGDQVVLLGQIEADPTRKGYRLRDRAGQITHPLVPAPSVNLSRLSGADVIVTGYVSHDSQVRVVQATAVQGDRVPGVPPPARSATLANYQEDYFDGYQGCDPCSLPYDSFGCDPAPIGPGWVRAEYLLWWIDPFSIPALVTTSPAGTDLADSGVLGLPSTQVLLGGEFDTNPLSGGRLTVGYFFDECSTLGIQASLAGVAADQRYQYSGPTILARPFFNVEPGLEGEDAEIVSHPDLADGQIQVSGETELYLADVLARYALFQDCYSRVDVLAGYRFGRLNEELVISDSRTVTSGDFGIPVGTQFGETDRFKTENEFHGPELGILWEGRSGCWTFELLTKLALGNTRSTVTINGNATVQVPGAAATTTPAGLLAQESNIGQYEENGFTVIPELGATIGYDITKRLRLTVGYNLVYWSQIARPGDQIDRNLNLSQLDAGGLVGAPFPQFTFVKTDVWAQGLSAGLDYRF